MKILFNDLTHNVRNAEMFGDGYWVTAEFDGLNHYLQIAIIDTTYVITDIDNIEYYIIEDCETLREALLRFFNSWYAGYDDWQDRLSKPKDDSHEYNLCIIECNKMNTQYA